MPSFDGLFVAAELCDYFEREQLVLKTTSGSSRYRCPDDPEQFAVRFALAYQGCSRTKQRILRPVIPPVDQGVRVGLEYVLGTYSGYRLLSGRIENA